jgi:hypothetical protein
MMGLWKALIPDFCPSEFQFNLWIVTYPKELLEWGIKETAVKFHRKQGKMDNEYLVKFTCSILKAKQHQSLAVQQMSGQAPSLAGASSS